MLAAVAVGHFAGAWAAAPGSIEYEIKATYLYKFAPFVDWPPSIAASPAFALCVVGDDPVSAAIDQAVRGQSVDGKPLIVKHLPVAAPDSGCQIMYIAGSDAQSVEQALAAMKAAPVDRGIVSFVIDANHVRFDIDKAAAAQSGLVISSKLLGLAHNVKPRTTEGSGG